MDDQFVFAIISCAATVFSAYIGWKTFRVKNSSHHGKNLISEYAEMLDGDSENQRSFAINEIHAFAIKNKEYRAIICDILCSHIKRINAFEMSPVSGKAGNIPEVKKILDLLFASGGVFEEEQKDLQNTIFLNWHLGKTHCVRNVNFSGCNFTNCEFHSVVFYNCKMSEVVINNCTFKNNTELNKCLLNGASINNKTLFRNVVIKDSTLKGAKISDVQFVRTDFGSLIFYTADISASKFVHCEIMHCDFTYAHFRNVSMEFKNTKLMNVQIQYFDSLELKYTADTTSNTISL